MMRFRSLSKLRSYLLPVVAAIVLAAGPVACSSTGEEEPSATLEGAASGEEAASGNVANGNEAAAGENANANANTEAANTAKPEGEASSSNNPIGNELNNAIGGEGGANASAETANTEANANAEAANANANANASAEPNALAGDAAANASAPVAGPADANVSNPFSGGASAPMPSENAAPTGNTAYSATNTPAAEAPQASSPPATAAPATAESSASEGSVSGPSTLPEMGSKMAYYVMRGDTLGAIAQKIYGSRGKWKALQTENGLVDANKIYPGDVIYFTLNDASKAFAEKYELSARQLYTVSQGDTLARLAAKFYGTQGAWRALWKENPQILNPDRIRVGLVLTYRTSEKVALKDEEETDGEDLQNSDGQASADEAQLEASSANEILTAATE